MSKGFLQFSQFRGQRLLRLVLTSSQSTIVPNVGCREGSKREDLHQTQIESHDIYSQVALGNPTAGASGGILFLCPPLTQHPASFPAQDSPQKVPACSLHYIKMISTKLVDTSPQQRSPFLDGPQPLPEEWAPHGQLLTGSCLHPCTAVRSTVRAQQKLARGLHGTGREAARRVVTKQVPPDLLSGGWGASHP